MRMDRRGDIGVATMILFIALTLVASVSASIIIDTANKVREQAVQTGNDAIADVSTGYELMYATGEVAGNVVTALHLHLRLAPGSPEIDVSGVIVALTVTSDHGSISRDLSCGPSNTAARGDRVEIIIGGLSAGPGDRVSVNIIPAAGFQTKIDLTIPDVLTPGTMILR